MAYLIHLSVYAALPKELPEYQTHDWTAKLAVLSGEISTGHRVLGVSAKNRYITDFKPRLLRPEDVPARIQLKSRRKTFPPFVRVRAALWGVREDVRAIIEDFEPGVHQFIEFELTDGSGRRADEKYFYLNITQFLEAILVEESQGVELLPKAPVTGINNGNPVYRNCDVKKKDRLVASRRKISNHHLWRSWLVPPNATFCSDALWSALRETKLTELLEAAYVEESDAPWEETNAMEQILAAQLAYRRMAQE